MPTSMVTNEVRKMVRDAGYKILAWALIQLAKNEQQNLVGLIIVALCLVPRKTELQNNGVISILTNFKLKNLIGYHHISFGLNFFKPRYFDKISATLSAFYWCDRIQPTHNLAPVLRYDDGIYYYSPELPDRSGDPESIELCDMAGAQYSYHFQPDTKLNAFVVPPPAQPPSFMIKGK